jgi:hypothetical protein
MAALLDFCKIFTNSGRSVMKKILLLAVLGIMAAAGNSFAWDIKIPGTFVQGEFRDLTRELGSAIAYRNLAPAEPLGITGFDVAAQASFISIDKETSQWKNVTNNEAPNYIAYPTIRARKGLPFGIDVGAMYSYISNTSIQLYGAEISKAILEGSVATPAVGIRGSYTRVAGAGDISLQTAGIDASISKGFIFITPYAGGGMIWLDGKYEGNVASLKRESIWQPRGFAGVKISPLPLVGLTAEMEYATRPIYSLKLGVSF